MVRILMINSLSSLVVHMQLVGGPTYSITLSAEVTRPSMELSSAYLDFGTVVCGQCKIITIRLHNPLPVKYVYFCLASCALDGGSLTVVIMAFSHL